MYHHNNKMSKYHVPSTQAILCPEHEVLCTQKRGQNAVMSPLAETERVRGNDAANQKADHNIKAYCDDQLQEF